VQGECDGRDSPVRAQALVVRSAHDRQVITRAAPSGSTDTAHSLDIRYRREGHHVEVALSGELDRATAPELRHGLEDLIGGQGNASVVVDLHGLTFIGSMGLTMLIETYDRVTAAGGTFVVSDPPPHARALLGPRGILDETVPGRALAKSVR
jgi:anti-anti-sigma factor